MIFNTDKEFQQYFPTGSGFTLSMVAPLYPRVERYFTDILGKTVWNALIASYVAAGKNVDSLNDEDRDLLDKIRSPYAHLCIYHYTPLGNLSVTAGGFTIADGQDRKAASQFRILQFQQAVLEQAYDGLDRLLGFLEEKKATYTAWAASDTYKSLNGHFIRNAGEFTLRININNNRWLYLQLVPMMTRVEDYRIRPILGDTLTDAILDKLKGSTALSAEENKLRVKVMEAVAYLTMVDAIPELGLKIDNYGITLYANERNSEQPSRVPSESHTDKLRAHYEKKGEASLKALETFLHDNHDDYPDYNYIAPTSEGSWRHNEENLGFVGI